jgi:hypothetical protein
MGKNHANFEAPSILLLRIQVCAGCDAGSLGKWFPTYRNNTLSLSSRVK